jgi:hypothetical protein
MVRLKPSVELTLNKLRKLRMKKAPIEDQMKAMEKSIRIFIEYLDDINVKLNGKMHKLLLKQQEVREEVLALETRKWHYREIKEYLEYVKAKKREMLV